MENNIVQSCGSCCASNKQTDATTTTDNKFFNPHFATPLDAFTKSEHERILYTIVVPSDRTKPDYLATVDVDPQSSTFSKIISRLEMPRAGDELHHTGWNACASCKGSAESRHKYLVLPSLKSGNIYFIDVQSDPRTPKIFSEITGEELAKGTNGGSYPHTTHCLPSGDIMISLMGRDGAEGAGGFAIIDGQTLQVKGRWESEVDQQTLGYDFWYQPKQNVMVSTQFGAPKAFWEGFNPADVAKGLYGKSLLFWNWSEKKLISQVDLGNDGLIPLEVRFPHNPDKTYGFVGAALSSSIIKFFKDETGQYSAKKVAQIESVRVKNWALDEMPGLITDILISLDDRYLYASCWLHGNINQYDISDPENIRLVDTLFIGGLLQKGGEVQILDKITGEVRDDLLHEIPTVQGKKLQGGPQMLQLSRDGKRLYVTSSLLRPWDTQFYPGQNKAGGQILKINVDLQNGGLKLDHEFLIDLSNEPNGPAAGHEMRYPGGDCSSDIWV